MQEAMSMPQLEFVGHLHPAQAADAKALQRFAQYLKGFRDSAKPLSMQKVGVAKTTSYTMVLKPQEESNMALEYWVRPGQ